MAYASTAVAHRPFSVATVPAFDAHLSLWHMIRDALTEARQAQMDREIATMLAGSGGKFTDESEREIERYFSAPSSHW